MSPLTRTIIDARSRQAFKFYRDPTHGASALDSSGNPIISGWDEVATGYGDIQPSLGRLREGQAGTVENIPGSVAMTHLAFVEERVEGVQARDVLEGEAGDRYLIVFMRDFKGAPQEFHLRRTTEEG